MLSRTVTAFAFGAAPLDSCVSAEAEHPSCSFTQTKATESVAAGGRGRQGEVVRLKSESC